MGVEVPLRPGVSAVLSQTCRDKDLSLVLLKVLPWFLHRMMETTDLDSVGTNVKHADGASDEVADGFEVHAADAPGAVHHQDDVRLSIGLTLSVCRDVGGTVSKRSVKRVKETPLTTAAFV